MIAKNFSSWYNEKNVIIFLCFSSYRVKGVSRLEDRQIISLYWSRDDRAIEATGQKYGAYCYAIADNILQCREDSEECVSDTWLQAWNTMPPQKPDRLRLYLGKITRNLAISRWRAANAQKRGGGQLLLILEELNECLPGGDDPAAQWEAAELAQCIRRFVAGLPRRDGDIFLRRYFFAESPEQIARHYRITGNHVAVSLSRSRKKLRQHLTKEGYAHEC